MELTGSVCFPATFPHPKCFHCHFLPTFSHLRSCGSPSFQLEVSYKRGGFAIISLGKKAVYFLESFVSKQEKKMLTSYSRNKDTEINYRFYNNQESHSEKRVGSTALLLGKCEEDFHFDGESRDRLSRLPSIIKESVVFRIEVRVHISCKTFLYFFNSLK